MQSDTWLKKIVVGHGADAGVGPDIDGGLNHVDYGIYGKYDAHDGNGGTDACHQREGQEEASHGDAGIADGGDDGNEYPKE